MRRLRDLQLLALLLASTALGCADGGTRGEDAPRSRGTTASTPASPSAATTPFRLGVAVVDTAARWCAMFPDADTMPAARVGDRITVVWADSSTQRASSSGRVTRVRGGRCDGDGPDSELAYELALDDSVRTAETPGVAHAIPGVSTWRVGPQGWAHGDVDHDGVEEIARACTSREGFHLTLWRQRPGASPTLWRHTYHYLGYDVEPSCTEEETREP